MSFMNNLRRMVGMKAKEETKKDWNAKLDPNAFNELSEKFFACKDEAEKAEIWKQMRSVLPDTLFLASMCYEGEDPDAVVNDRELHATNGSKRLYAINQAVVTNGNPGYRLAQKAHSRRIHLRMLVSNKTKENWVPLFTDFNKLLPVFGQKGRVTLISFDEAKRFAKPYTGIVINPQSNSIWLNNTLLRKVI